MFTRTTFSVSFLHISAVSVRESQVYVSWWRLNACVSMFCRVLRAAKGEHGEVGKLVWVRWLYVTIVPRLFLLQRLGRVGAGGAESLPEDGQEGDGEGEGSGEDHVPVPAGDGGKVEPCLLHD